MKDLPIHETIPVEAAASIGLNSGPPAGSYGGPGPVGPQGTLGPGPHPKGQPGTPPDYGVPADSIGHTHCYLCGTLFPADKRVNWRGHWICPGCWKATAEDRLYSDGKEHPLKHHTDWPKEGSFDEKGFICSCGANVRGKDGIVWEGVWWCPECVKRKKHDPVNHPSHYNAGKVECIDAIESALSPEEFQGFLKGQILKYTWRASHKGSPAQDIDKCLWYGNRLAKALNSQKG